MITFSGFAIGGLVGVYSIFYGVSDRRAFPVVFSIFSMYLYGILIGIRSAGVFYTF